MAETFTQGITAVDSWQQPYMNNCGLRGRWLAVSAALFLLLIGVLAGYSRQDNTPPFPRNADTSTVRSVPRAIGKRFSLFRSPPVGLPFSLVARLEAPLFGANWAHAQKLRWGTWAMPARKQVCLVKQRPDRAIAVTCTPIGEILSSGMFVASLQDPSMKAPGPQREIVGLAPDGTSGVRVLTPGYRTVTVGVNRNVFVQRDNIPASPQTVILLRD